MPDQVPDNSKKMEFSGEDIIQREPHSDSKESGIEQKITPGNHTREHFERLREQFSAAAEAELTREEQIKRDLSECPPRIQEIINSKLAKDIADGITSNEVLNERMLDYMKELKYSQCVERGGKLYTNKESIKDRVRETVRQSLEIDDYDALKKFGRIAIDLNGLKAINDFAGHEKGDIFIERVAQQLKKVEGVLKDRVGDFKFNDVELSLEGGDEFGFYIDAGRQLSTAEIETVNQLIHLELTLIDCSDLITPKEVRDHMPHLSVPEDYTFKVTAGAGYVSFDAALLSKDSYDNIQTKLQAKERKLGRSLRANEYIDVYMGRIMDVSDELQKESKTEGKNELKNGSESDRITWELTEIRDQKTRELVEANEKLQIDLNTCVDARQTLEQSKSEYY